MSIQNGIVAPRTLSLHLSVASLLKAWLQERWSRIKAKSDVIRHRLVEIDQVAMGILEELKILYWLSAANPAKEIEKSNGG